MEEQATKINPEESKVSNTSEPIQTSKLSKFPTKNPVLLAKIIGVILVISGISGLYQYIQLFIYNSHGVISYVIPLLTNCISVIGGYLLFRRKRLGLYMYGIVIFLIFIQLLPWIIVLFSQIRSLNEALSLIFLLLPAILVGILIFGVLGGIYKWLYSWRDTFS